MSECYECQPKPAAKTYPGCTIRNTPSEPIHCIVWAKHLFNQLFGEPDADNDVSPETEKEEGMESGEDDSHVQRVSTRQWAENNDYNSKKLFHKVRVKNGCITLCFELMIKCVWIKIMIDETICLFSSAV